MTLKAKDLERAQKEKERLEEAQRRDRKLRMAFLKENMQELEETQH